MLLAMSSDLHAFVVRPSAAAQIWATAVGVPVVDLPFGLNLIPLTDQVLSRTGDESDRVGGFYRLYTGLAERGRLLSSEGQVAYVYEESFGGTGIQEAVGWWDGAVAFGPRFTSDAKEDDRFETVPDPRQHAVNETLRWLGVDKSRAVDEFTAAGLDAHRHTTEWT